MGRVLRARVEVAPAQGAIPGILRFGTRECGQRGGEQDTQSWGVAPGLLVPPPDQTWGLASPSPAPLLEASGRGGEALRRCPPPPKNAALQGTALSSISVSVQVFIPKAPSLSGGKGLSVRLLAPCLSVFLCLSPHHRMSSISLPALSFLGPVVLPHLCLSGWGWGS